MSGGEVGTGDGTAFIAGFPNGWIGLAIYGYSGKEANFFVMDTDYENYSLVAGCSKSLNPFTTTG